ncbi:MAG: hypothetical protein NTZ83_03300 [Candidatus Pacearchaeota archaeon]|nr:hypothetical protein [Candidatus Pacearchaeota archaeon]
MVSKKDRRHNGYVTPRLTISPVELVRYDLFVDTFYDDWEDYRDSYRDWFRDFKTIKKAHLRRGKYFCEELFEKRIHMNLKQKKLIKRRKFRKSHAYY